MKTIMFIFTMLIPAFFPITCNDHHDLDCSEYDYTLADLVGTYRADKIETLIMCDTSQQNSSNFVDSLNYFLQLNDDYTGRIFGPDTLTDFKWIFENITSGSDHSGSCYHTFTIWTEHDNFKFYLLSAGKYGFDYYANDSTWDYKNCVRQKFHYFLRVE